MWIGRPSALMLAALFAGSAWAEVQPRDPPALVYLRDVDPTIEQDIRYATAANFTGDSVPGYQAAECLLTPATAAALRRVQVGLAPRGLSLRVYDCYRPERAVRAFIRWTRQPSDDPATKDFYPRTRRADLISLGYIAAVSAHSRGNTVDLTLVPRGAAVRSQLSTAGQHDCTLPVNERGSDGSVDMGTSFDCFDEKSATASPDITPEQRKPRDLLLRAMEAGGFRNYRREWWHFTYGDGAGPSYDVPIMPRDLGRAQPQLKRD